MYGREKLNIHEERFDQNVRSSNFFIEFCPNLLKNNEEWYIMKKWIFMFVAMAFIVVGCSQENNDHDYEQLKEEYEELLEKYEERELEYEQLEVEVEQLRQELEDVKSDSDSNEESDGNNDDNSNNNEENGGNGQEEEVPEEAVEGIDGSVTLDQGYYIVGADIPAGKYIAQADGEQSGILNVRGPDGATKYENAITNEGVSIELEQGDTLEIDVSTTITAE